jgi:hypothetical protein
LTEKEYKSKYQEAWDAITDVPAAIKDDLDKVRRWKGTVADRTVKGRSQKEPDLQQWLKQYASQKGRSPRATKGVNEYREKHAPWAEPGEVYLSKTELPPGVEARRFDIANRHSRRAVEFKEFQGGKRDIASVNNDIRREIAADRALIADGWQINWVFKGYRGLSGGLKKLLAGEPPKIPRILYEVIE